MNCNDCRVKDSVDYCDECDNEFCFDCRLANTEERDGEDCCKGCAPMVLPMILKKLSMQNEDMAKLRKENEELRVKLECKNSE